MHECFKKRYFSWQHASNDARALRHKDDNATTEVYHCRVCHAWHVGNAGLGHGPIKKKPQRVTSRYRDRDDD